MLSRRSLLTGGLFTGGTAAAAGADPQRSTSSSSSVTDEQMVKVLEEIRDVMKADEGANCPEIAVIRALQREYLKGHGKFGDFMDVGIDVWDNLTNWHIRTRQPVQVTRSLDGRYSMAVLQTNIILRHDAANSYISQPYDAK